MIVEGKGKVAPSPVPYVLTPEEMRCIYNAIPNLNHYGTRQDAWGIGLKQPLVIPSLGILTSRQRSIFAGKLGEYGFCRVCGSRTGITPHVDLSRRRGGDGGTDVLVCGLSLQIKTRQSDRIPNLIKRAKERGEIIRLEGEAHVFCKWIEDCYVHLLGWQWNRMLMKMKYPLCPARAAGDWKNIEVPDEDLLPMGRLWAEIDARKERCA